MAQRTDQVSVTLAAIARLAGVGRAAVSNWRRRLPDFPEPVGGTDASPQFALDAVEEWLKRHDKIAASAGPLERLWPRIADLGDRDRMGRVVAGLGARIGDAPTGLGPSADQRGGNETLGPVERMLVDEAAQMAGTEGATETFRFLLDRWLTTHVRQITTTPAPLAALMVEIAAAAGNGRPVRTVADPACGTGTLLLEAARRWSEPDTGEDALRLLGSDADTVLAAVAEARLAVEAAQAHVTVTAHDTLRDAADPLPAPADVVLCSPPANERDWGHEELATDRRWAYGQPPRTESELAWIQHIVSMLGEGGDAGALGRVAVVLLPPGVAARRAGRRIRAGLLRAGVLRAVVALPAGAAPPYGVGLHLWVLAAPAPRPQNAVVLVDAADCRHTPPTVSTSRLPAVDWGAVLDRVRLALQGSEAPGSVSIPVTDLLGEETDLTPARHVAASPPVRSVDLRRLWAHYDKGLLEARDAGSALRGVSAVQDAADHGTVSVAELEQAKALTLASGAALPEETVRRGKVPDDGVELLTGLFTPHPPEPQWLDRSDAEQADREGRFPLTSFGDVVVVATTHGFDAWVETSAPRALGQYLHRLRVDPARLDPWFLAACLRERSNARRAGTHASNTSRVDVRRLRALRLPLDEQQAYGEIHRKLVDLEKVLADLGAVGQELSEGLTALLAAGRLERR
ncbi:class I SAM-dependent DNA methyltransferase [Streptomyces sp. NPDC058357]|uniref:HsdM family class I SAM-dependent methyltransferase n=1 Tax=unclassified Streptomyces TaxID=2593676 RepID=UPI0036686EFB